MTATLKDNLQAKTDGEVNRLAMELIDSQTTMTLATASDDTAWAAPVYYVFYSQGFYFFSNPKSRHILDALSSRKSSAAIHVPSKKWQDIRGIQMIGKIKEVTIGRQAAHALGKYLVKFPFCGEFFSLDQPLKLDRFLGKFKVKLYKLTPDSMYYLDNRIRFGFRELIILPSKG